MQVDLTSRRSLYCVDGSNLGFRSFCAFPDLSVHGFQVGAVYGAARILNTFVTEFPPGKLVMPFDIGKSRYRQGIYPEYKAKRAKNKNHAEQREKYGEQLPMLIELVEKFGVTTITEQARGYEGDDIISYLVDCFTEGKFPGVDRVLILSSDKDLCALVRENVKWYDPINKLIVDSKNFEDEHEITVAQYPDYKVLKGDSSDNIPHPPGVGPKTAVKLLNEYGSIDKLFEHRHHKVIGHEAVIELARKLVRLDLHREFPKDQVWENIFERVTSPSIPDKELVSTLEMLSFRSILDKWHEIGPRWDKFNEVNLT